MMKKFTEKEKLRISKYNDIVDNLIKESYQSEELTINILAANILVIVIFVPLILIVIGLYLYLYNQDIFTVLSEDPFITMKALLIFIVCVPIHEYIHGLTFGHYAPRGKEAIEYGFQVKTLTPYCYCGDPLDKNSYILGSFMPTLVLGILMIIIGFIMKNIALVFAGLLNASGGMGDLMVIFKILKYKNNAKDILYIDHPYKAGLTVFYKE